MMLLFSFERSTSGSVRYEQDILKIFRRFDAFKGSHVRKGSLPSFIDYCGLRLNMREFHRALVIGTSKTKRKKNAKTQANFPSNSSPSQPKAIGTDKSFQYNGYDSDATPDMSFSSDLSDTEVPVDVAKFMLSPDKDLVKFIESDQFPKDVWFLPVASIPSISLVYTRDKKQIKLTFIHSPFSPLYLALSQTNKDQPVIHNEE